MSRLIQVVAGIVCAAACAVAHAQAYPSKPVRIVVPYSAGGGLDTLVRALAQRLTATWGQSVQVENKPGASAIVGTEYVIRSAPDGHTILLTDATFVLNTILGRKLSYEPFRDLTPVTGLVNVTLALVATPSLPAKDVRELIRLAKSRPGELSYGSFGTGSSGHLGVELLQTMAQIELNHVPYKGTAPALVDMTAGRLHLMLVTVGSAVPHWKAGKIAWLAVADPSRMRQYPQIPAISEAVPGYEAGSWFGLHAPTGTPREAIDRVNSEVRKILSDPEFGRQHLEPQGFDPIAGTPEQLLQHTKAEATKWTKVVRDAKVKLEN